MAGDTAGLREPLCPADGDATSLARGWWWCGRHLSRETKILLVNRFLCACLARHIAPHDASSIVNMASTRWGIMGTGAIANDFAQALKTTPGAVLHAAASRSQASADAFAKKHGIARSFGSYEELAADGAVDIVYVATPHAFHRDNVLLCLGAGRHVLCEKPLAVSAAQVAECVAAARERNLFLMEGMWTRFFPVARAIRKAVAEGAIGKVVSVSASLGFKLEPSFNPRLYEPALAGGALFDVGIYPALWISMILGTPSKARRLRHLLRLRHRSPPPPPLAAATAPATAAGDGARAPAPVGRRPADLRHARVRRRDGAPRVRLHGPSCQTTRGAVSSRHLRTLIDAAVQARCQTT